MSINSIEPTQNTAVQKKTKQETEKKPPQQKRTQTTEAMLRPICSLDRLELERPQCPLGAVGQAERIP